MRWFYCISDVGIFVPKKVRYAFLHDFIKSFFIFYLFLQEMWRLR